MRMFVFVLAAALASSCASAPRRGGTVSGLFDGRSEQVDRDADGIPDTVDKAEGDAGGAMGGEATVEVSARAPMDATKGLFDFKKSEPPKPSAMKAPSTPAASAAPAEEKPADEPEKPEPAATHDDGKQVEASGPRLVIYKGNLTVLVPAVDPAVEKLSARAKELGGYVENQSGNASANNATVTMRIPAEKFYDVVNELGAYGQVTEKQISAQDVTKQVFDTELRLDVADKARLRLLELLKTAAKTEDILQIENEVRRLTEEIEGMKGELRFLKDQVSMSTLAVTFYSNAPPPTATRARTRSRFDWINAVGIESVLAGF